MRERLDDDWRLIKVLGPYGPYRDQRGEYYKVVTDIKNPAGEVKRQQARTPTREAADLLKESLEAKLNQQSLVEPQAEATVADLLRAWRVDQEGRKTLTPNRLQCIDSLQRRFSRVLPDHATPLRKAIPKITRAYFQYIRGSHKPRTMKSMRGSLIELGRAGKNKGLLPVNPWATLPQIEQRNSTPPRPRLAVHEALALWRCCRGLVLTRSRYPYWTIALRVALMLGTGLRLGDVQDAQVRGLDSWGGAEVLRIFQGKSSAAARVLRLGSCRWLVEALRDLAVGRAPDAFLFTRDPLPDLSRALQEVDFNAHSVQALCQRLGISRRKLLRLRGRTPSLEPTDPTTIRKGVHRMCRRAGITPVGPHGLRRTNTDLRALVGDPTLRALVAETDRQALGHRAGSDTMEQVYLAPELRMMRASLDGESVLRFLESQTAESAPASAPSAEPATAAPAVTVPPRLKSSSADLTELVKRLGGKDALRRLLEDLPE